MLQAARNLITTGARAIVYVPIGFVTDNHETILDVGYTTEELQQGAPGVEVLGCPASTTTRRCCGWRRAGSSRSSTPPRREPDWAPAGPARPRRMARAPAGGRQPAARSQPTRPHKPRPHTRPRERCPAHPRTRSPLVPLARGRTGARCRDASAARRSPCGGWRARTCRCRRRWPSRRTGRRSWCAADSAITRRCCALPSGAGWTPRPRYAVRSSADVEDGEVHSFAGQFTTRLDVRPGDVLRHRRGRRPGQRAPRRLPRTRHRAGAARIGVVVQDMVDATAPASPSAAIR